MKYEQTPVASAVAMILLGAVSGALAQQAAAPAAAPASAAPAPEAAASGAQLNTVTVTGIRSALERSLNAKRNADSVVDVITSEDVGKMPDKNVADSLQRVPGVTISAASAGEGGFDENDRVSLRGTNPSLTQTTINGHMVGSGDWFVLNQVGTVGRSVSYSLLPSELVDQVVVHKSSQADLVEGGVAGSVDIVTRKPLDFRKPLSLEVSLGGVYADLPGKTDSQFNGIANWKNEANTLGVLVQAFSERRHLRRDGQEMLGYTTIAAGSKVGTSNPDLVGVAVPNFIGSALFEQERKRQGGLIDVQLKPSNDLSFDLSGFKSHMEASNYNRNFLVWPVKAINDGQAPDPGYVVRNGTLTSATFSNQGVGTDPTTRRQYAIDDQIYRPGAYSDSNFVNLDAKWAATDRWTVFGKVGDSRGKGETPKEVVFEGDIFNSGSSYQLNGLGRPADASLPNGNPSNFAGTTLDWIFGSSPARTKDEEKWAQLDNEYALQSGVFSSVKFGLRVADHTRSSTQVAQGPDFSKDPFNPANLPVWTGGTYPGDFASGLPAANFPKTPWQIDPGSLQTWSDQYTNRDPVARRYWPGEFALKEKVTAAYVMTTLDGSGWGGNVGVRLVRTQEHVLVNVGIPDSQCPAQTDCPSVPNAITTSAFGSFYQQGVDNTYTDVLPSANLRVDLSPDLLARFAAAKTMARPDYSALGGAVSLDDLSHTGSGGNPNLKPIRSTNLDASIEWYFAPRALLSAGAFLMNLDNYVSYGVADTVFKNIQTGRDETYAVTSPVNSSGKVRGLEFAWQQPVWGGFGLLTNYTYANAHESGGGDLVGASKNTYNIVGYYENNVFNARVAYNYRSKFFNGLDRSSAQYEDGTGNLAASIGVKLNDTFSVTLDGQNLNNPVLKYYANNRDQPNAFYVNGRQFYLTLRAKL